MTLSKAKPCPWCGKKPGGIMRAARREFSLVHECLAPFDRRHGVYIEVRESSEAACIESWNSRTDTGATASTAGIEAIALLFEQVSRDNNDPNIKSFCDLNAALIREWVDKCRSEKP